MILTKKKALLTVVLLFAIIIGINELPKIYKEHWPLAQVGECIEATDDNLGPIKLRVMKNDNTKYMATLIFEMPLTEDPMLGAKMYFSMTASYGQLRDIGAKKVNCE